MGSQVTPPPSTGNKATPGERYEHFLAFLDDLMTRAERLGLRFRDRLDAQGVVWSVTNGHLPEDVGDDERAAFAQFIGANIPEPQKADGLPERDDIVASNGRIPDVTPEQVLRAMDEFDQHDRDSEQWRDWESRPQFRWAIIHEGRRYPVKEMISRATGVPTAAFSGGDESNRYLKNRGFIVERLREATVSGVWWVNQGATYQQEREGGFLWAPVKGKTGNTFGHWTNMTKVQAGDFVLHYANTAIRAVSIVQEASIHAPKPDSLSRQPWEDDGYLVRSDYTEFDSPISLKDIPADLRKGQSGGPFTQQGGVNQGYLFPAPDGLLEHLVHRFKVNWPESILNTIGPPNSRLFKIAPGPGGSEWDDCLTGGYICVGWDDVGSLLQFDSFGQFLDAFRAAHGDEYKGREHKIVEKAQELWTLRELTPDDHILANRGTSQILGVGTVVEPGYDWLPERESMRHVVHVEWGVQPARTIPPQGYWAFKTVLTLPDNFLAQLNEEAEVSSYEPPVFSATLASVQAMGLKISERTLRRYHLSLMTRGFVILAGVSGTGKTWLAEAYAQSVGAKHAIVSVAPNWTTNEDLIGYFNPITEVYHDTSFSRFMREAATAFDLATDQGRTPQPFHLVLDEMSLARVEHYFASFLSAMEVRARHGTAAMDIGVGEHLELPPNLFIVGTVNIDETTHGFADKVWDRS